jgi:ABC-type dipeptide/oligopeptide/nickel transport system ATPase subunit
MQMMFDRLYDYKGASTDLESEAAASMPHASVIPAGSGAQQALHPVGSGPLEMVSYTPDQSIILKANPTYWNKGLPYVSGVHEALGVSPEVELLELEKGQIDLMGDPLPNSDYLTVVGSKIAMITQDPLSSLNPLVRIGTQITEMLRYHRGLSRGEARAKAEELLRSVGIPDPRRTMTRYPAVLSGGMRQRVALAIAISCEPRLLIADEPTTALDVTVQAQVLTLLERMTAEHSSAVLLISHDLGVVGTFCDRLLVMYAGRIVESGPTAAAALPDGAGDLPAIRSRPPRNPSPWNARGFPPSGSLSRGRRRNLEQGSMMTDPAHLQGAMARRVHVAARVPAEAIGAGSGMASEYANTNLMGAYDIGGEELSFGLHGLRIGDVVALADNDHRYGRGYREGWLTIGVISTGSGRLFGHGPGPSTIMSGRPRRSPSSTTRTPTWPTWPTWPT